MQLLHLSLQRKVPSCAFPNTRCADRPNLFCLASKQAPLEEERGGEERRAPFTLLYMYPHPIAAKREGEREGTQHLERGERESIKKQRGRFRVIEPDIIDSTRHGIAGETEERAEAEAEAAYSVGPDIILGVAIAFVFVCRERRGLCRFLKKLCR